MSERARTRRIAILRHLGTLLLLLAVFTSFGGCSGCGCGRCSARPPGPPDTPTPDTGPPRPPPPSSSRPSSCSCGGFDYPWDAPALDTPADSSRDTPLSTLDVPRDPCDYTTPGVGVGATCLPGGSCEGGLTCEVGLLVPLITGEPRLIPTSTCAIACDPAADDCGPCARCSGDIPVGAGRLTTPPVCRPRCTPTSLDRGDCLPGFTCDPRTAVCVPACRTDLDCQLEPVVTADGVAFAEQPLLTCDLLTGRCLHPDPSPAAGIGAPCADDLDCAASDACWRPSLGRLGTCTRLACTSLDPDCDLGSICAGDRCVPWCMEGIACPAGLGCDLPTGTCQLTCASSAECAAGQVCQTELGCTGECFCTVDTRP